MLKAVLIGLTIVYPFLIYYGLAHFRPGVFGIALLALILFRVSGLQSDERNRFLIPLVLLMAYSVLIAVSDSEVLLRFYPVLMSLMMLFVFARTLWYPPTMIERLARLRGMVISEAAKGMYMHRLTTIWCIFFVINASIATYTATYTSLKVWALYNGFLSYLFMGVLFGAEMIFRVYYKRRIATSQNNGRTP